MYKYATCIRLRYYGCGLVVPDMLFAFDVLVLRFGYIGVDNFIFHVFFINDLYIYTLFSQGTTAVV